MFTHYADIYQPTSSTVMPSGLGTWNRLGFLLKHESVLWGSVDLSLALGTHLGERLILLKYVCGR